LNESGRGEQRRPAGKSAAKSQVALLLCVAKALQDLRSENPLHRIIIPRRAGQAGIPGLLMPLASVSSGAQVVSGNPCPRFGCCL